MPQRINSVLVQEALPQVQYRGGPESDEDRRLAPAGEVQGQREDDGEQCPTHVDSFAAVHELPPVSLLAPIYPLYPYINCKSDHRSLQEVCSTCPEDLKPSQGGLIREAARRSSGRGGLSPASTRAPPWPASALSMPAEPPPMHASRWPPRWPFSHRCRREWVATHSCCTTRPRQDRLPASTAQAEPLGLSPSRSSWILARCLSLVALRLRSLALS